MYLQTRIPREWAKMLRYFNNLTLCLHILKSCTVTNIFLCFQTSMNVPMDWITVMSMQCVAIPKGATSVLADKDTAGMGKDAQVC